MALNNLTRYALMSGGMRSNNGGMRSEGGGNRMEYGGGMQNQMRGGYENNYRPENGMRTENRGREGGARNEYRGGSEGGSPSGYISNGYEPVENRFRDRTGREHYDNGRFAPMRSEYEGGSSGAYMGQGGMPMRSEIAYMGGDSESRRGGMTESRNQPARSMDEMLGHENEPPQYRDEMNDDGMRRIYGFSVLQGGRSAQANYQGLSKEPEVGWRGDSHTEKGYSHSQSIPPMTREMAEEWMSTIKNEDGTVGPHWTLEQVKQLMQQKGIQGDPVRVWVAINAEYSDMHMVNKKYGVDRPEYYLDAAIARWLNDADAVKNKDSAYYLHVVRH